MELSKHMTKWDALVVLILVFHVFMAPYTKVEESFNTQAMHDLLYHRHHLHKYDHFEFPGVVPRTFIGAMIVSLLSAPFVLIITFLQLPKLYALIVVRLILGCISFTSWLVLRSQIIKTFGLEVASAFTVITALQFHLLFYFSRPLPNVFAMALTMLAFAWWINGQFKVALIILVVAAVIFRCDVILLLGPIGLSFLLRKNLSISSAIKCCLTAAIFSIIVTVMLDSIMWQRLLWPELNVFLFNSVQNRSSEWGVSPVHWYFSSALPRAMLGSLPLCFVGLIFERRLAEYIIPVFAFVVLYSKLPHKELRFILHAIPLLDMSAAVALARVYNNRHKSRWKLGFIGCVFLLLGSAFLAAIMSGASYLNYPGGHALHILHHVDSDVEKLTPRTIHIDVLPAMTGISRFCERGPPWIYSKEENLSNAEFSARNFTYLLSSKPNVPGFNCLFSVDGFSKIAVQIASPPVRLVTEPHVFIQGKQASTLIDYRKWPGCFSKSVKR